MAIKYRVRLKNGRVVGPFIAKQIGELYLKGHILGDEQAQTFPVGDWVALKKIDELRKALIKVASQDYTTTDFEQDENHTIAKLSVAKKAKSEKKIESEQKSSLGNEDDFKEFKFSASDSGPEVDYDELEKKYEKRIQEEQKQQDKPSAVGPTRIIKRPEINSIEKTKIVNPPALREERDVDEEEDENHKEKEEVEVKADVDEKEDEFSSDDKTQMLDLKSELQKIKEEAKSTELEIIEKERLANEEDQELEEDYEEDEEGEEESKSILKKLKPIHWAAIAGLLIFVLLPSEKEGPKKIEPIFFEMIFPVANEFRDEAKAQRSYEKGLETLKNNTYIERMKAAKNFELSLKHSFKENPAMNELLRIYSYDYENAKDKNRAAKNIFRLMKINSSETLTNDDVASSVARFYFKNEKDLTAQRIIENYLRLGKPSERLYNVYVDILIEQGDYVLAKKVLEGLEQISDKSVDSYLSISNYYHVDQRFDKSLEVLNEGLQKYKTSVPLMLKAAEVLLSKKDFEKMKVPLAKVKELGAERSPVYFSKLLELEGIIAAFENNQELATSLFKKALTYADSDELRSMLAQAELKGEESLQALILESKVIELMGRAKDERRKRDWDMALSYAIEAADLMPNYIPAQMLLVSIQSERGFFEPALSNLTRLRKDFPINASINYALLKTYLTSHQIEEAEKEISILSQTEFVETAEYATALGEFYEMNNSMEMSVRFFKEAIKRDPLNDENYHKLAKIYLRYNQFDDSREMILEAIDLDPTNVYYHSIYASILYETQTAEAAIGYLRGVLEKNEDHPKILGDIAVYYYRSGQVTQFEEYKKRVERLNRRDESFYEFLVESSRLRGKERAVVDYSRELIRVNPGNLETRMELGEYLLSRNYYEDALDEFSKVLERLESYPRANYYIARCYVLKEDYAKALEHAEKEIEMNPTLEFGHYIKGEVLRLQENYQEAVKNLEKAISINSTSIEALLALGWIKFRQNDLETSRELYRRAFREDESIPEVHVQLGHIYRASGQSLLAVESYETYLKLAPNASDRPRIESLIRQLR